MKKLVLFAGILFATITTASAQFSAGAGLTYATTEFNSLGLNLRAAFDINDAFRISADFNPRFAESEDFLGVEVKYKASEFNGNLHYKFNDTWYLLGGFNLISIGAEIEAINADESESYFGINLGGGAMFEVADQIKIFVEPRLTFNFLDDSDQDGSRIVLSAGAVYVFE